MNGRAWWCVVLLFTACDSLPNPDVDGGTVEDAAIADAGADAASVCECDAGEQCVRGVCIATCGGDVSGFDAALGEGLTPVASFCRTASAYAVHASATDLLVYDLTTSVDGLRTVFSLSRWTLDPSVSTPSPVEVASATHDVASADESVFPGGYLAIDPTGAQAVFGYTTSAAGFPGGVFYASLTGGASVMEVPAPGNFDVAWMDPTHFVVDGSGLAELAFGQGLYVADLTAAPRAVHVATNMGDYSGSVAASPAFVIGAAVIDGSFESHAYYFSKERVDTAIADATPIDTATDSAVTEVLDPDGVALPSTFSTVRTRIVSTPFAGPLTSYAVALGASGPTLSDPRVLATATFTDAMAAGDGHILLVHPSGLLLVAE